MKRLSLSKSEVKKINEIIDELDVEEFDLLFDASSGIGYTLDLEYQTTLNNREVHVRVPVTGVENW